MICKIYKTFFRFSYRLRIDGLLIKEEFKANLEYIKPSIDSVIEAAKGKGDFFHVKDIFIANATTYEMTLN